MTLKLTFRSLTGVLFLLFVGCQSGVARQIKSVGPDSLALRVDCQPEEAEVRVDGVLQGTCKLLAQPEAVMTLSGGTHELEIAADGYRSSRSTITGKGIQESLTIRLMPRKAE